MLDKDELIAKIRYSSKWNKPCPEWVYKLIEATDKITNNYISKGDYNDSQS